MTTDFPATASRRQFLKTFALASATSVFLEQTGSAQMLAEIAPATTTDAGQWRVTISDFPALQNDFGSIRLGTARIAGKHSPSPFPPLLINRAPGGEFHALDARCTHEDCVVQTLNIPTPPTHLAMSTCPCHNSRFTVDGTVVAGSAARFSLTRFKSSLADNLLTIEVPGMAFNVVTSPTQPQSERIQLEFLAFGGIEYEIRGRTDLSAAWEPVSFALTASSAFDQTTFRGHDDFARIHVPSAGPLRFFAVVVRTFPI